LSSQIQLRKEKEKVFITIYKLKEKRREEGTWLGKMTN